MLPSRKDGGMQGGAYRCQTTLAPAAAWERLRITNDFHRLLFSLDRT
jgi:hypothetical protein